MKTRDLINCQKINVEYNTLYCFDHFSSIAFTTAFSITIEFDLLSGYSCFIGKDNSIPIFYHFLFISGVGFPNKYLKVILRKQGI